MEMCPCSFSLLQSSPVLIQIEVSSDVTRCLENERCFCPFSLINIDLSSRSEGCILFRLPVLTQLDQSSSDHLPSHVNRVCFDDENNKRSAVPFRTARWTLLSKWLSKERFLFRLSHASRLHLSITLLAWLQYHLQNLTGELHERRYWRLLRMYLGLSIARKLDQYVGTRHDDVWSMYFWSLFR